MRLSRALVNGKGRHRVLKAEYARRAGIEGTVSRAVRICSQVRRSKYIGLAKTHLCTIS